jgi:virulence-associated protein VagC
LEVRRFGARGAWNTDLGWYIPIAYTEIGVAAMAERRAKLFKNGRSQAVRLPKEFRFEGTEVRIWRSGDTVFLAPVTNSQGAGGQDAVREALKNLGPMNAGFAAMVEEGLRKLREGGGGGG